MLRSIAPVICLAGCVLAGCVRPIPAGALPKYATGRATYWTAVGVPGAAEEALVNEEGMVEVAAGRFSLEPFVEVDGRLVTWADVACEQRLVDGDLPMPVVTWRHPAFTLEVSVLADGTAEQSEAWVRYRLVPAENEASRVRLVVAMRPAPPVTLRFCHGGRT